MQCYSCKHMYRNLCHFSLAKNGVVKNQSNQQQMGWKGFIGVSLLLIGLEFRYESFWTCILCTCFRFRFPTIGFHASLSTVICNHWLEHLSFHGTTMAGKNCFLINCWHPQKLPERIVLVIDLFQTMPLCPFVYVMVGLIEMVMIHLLFGRSS